MRDSEIELNNEVIQADIERLEKRQLRAMREHLLGDPLALAKLQNTDDKIKALRQSIL